MLNIVDQACLLYTSDAADERSSVDLGGRRIIKKKKKNNKDTTVIIIYFLGRVTEMAISMSGYN